MKKEIIDNRQKTGVGRFVGIFKLLLLLFPALILSCESLVSEVSPKNLNIPESKLVLTCFISPQDTTLYATLTESISLFSKRDVSNDFSFVLEGDTTWFYNDVVKNAQIKLSDGKEEILFRYNDTLRVYYYNVNKTNFNILAGKTYTISAEDATRKVSGTCTVPNSKPTIASYVIEKDTSLITWAKGVRNRIIKVKLAWLDANKPNTYYRLAGNAKAAVSRLSYSTVEGVFQKDSTKISRDTTVYSVFWGRDKLLTNKNFEGTKFSETGTIHLGYSHALDFFGNNSKGVALEKPSIFDMEVALFEVEENYHIYHRIIRDNFRNESNPFSEPTPSFTNIKNGLGCFGASNKAIIKIQKEKLPKF